MKPGGRIQAAIEVLDDVLSHHRPASIALSEWGRAHRFAGSGDRSSIGNLVYDALRVKSASTTLLGEETSRALVLGALVLVWKQSLDEIAVVVDGSQHAPDALTDAERQALESFTQLQDAPPHIQANIPEWLWPSFEEMFEDDAVAEGQALAERAPLDLRVNTLKSTLEKVQKALTKAGAKPCRIASNGLRIAPPPATGRTPNVQNEPGFQRGHFEIQDEGSQIVSELVFAKPGEQILDYCAGGGGKTLALAAAMKNKGQIFAYDSNKGRLAPIHQRLKRAGAHNVQVRTPSGDGPATDLADLVGKMDRVVIDAPCTGTGVWRRRPDAKWKLTPEALTERQEEQRNILADARNYVRPGGYLCYITCSVLPVENEHQVHHFIEHNPDFELVSAEEAWRELYGFDKPSPWSDDMASMRLTPASTGTDGFYFAVLERRKED